MKFNTRAAFDNHKLKFCIKSKYDDPEFLTYMQLEEKFRGKQEKRIQSLSEATGIDQIKKKIRDLDLQLLEEEEEDQKSMKDVEKLVQLWKDNKRVIGVRDSEVETRLAPLFYELDNSNKRRNTYMADIQMIKKKLDVTYALTTEDMVRRKALEEILLQRDGR